MPSNQSDLYRQACFTRLLVLSEVRSKLALRQLHALNSFHLSLGTESVHAPVKVLYNPLFAWHGTG